MYRRRTLITGRVEVGRNTGMAEGEDIFEHLLGASQRHELRSEEYALYVKLVCSSKDGKWRMRTAWVVLPLHFVDRWVSVPSPYCCGCLVF